ncbi:hypothetical protein [Gracilimonas sp.]|uniref:hypothetical protein n=1 Tax=Gracilimonas sp. TaxID=1974203 RepID=UPI0028712B22|nr:hypothetical protein [Gracilimonas sp.]
MILQKLLSNFSVLILLVVSTFIFNSCKGENNKDKTISLEPYAIVDEDIDVEVSGLVQSPSFENIFWLHGDAGDEATIYPIDKEGERPENSNDDGVKLMATDNEDWEDIAADDEGNIYIGDIGNNCLCRDELAILGFREPNISSQRIFTIDRYRFKYSGSFKNKKGKEIVPNAEALFYFEGTFYIITKEAKGTNTKLFKMSNPSASQMNSVDLLDTINFDDKVTGADISSSGDSVAILTFSSIWLLQEFTDDNFFSGTIQKVFFEANQVESIAFTNDSSLIIAEETGELYEIPFSAFN